MKELMFYVAAIVIGSLIGVWLAKRDIRRSHRIDWSLAPPEADGWARNGSGAFWWGKPPEGQRGATRLGPAPDLVPHDGSFSVSFPRGFQP